MSRWCLALAWGCTFQTKVDEIDVDVGTGPPDPTTTTTPSTSTPPVDTASDTGGTPSTAADGIWISLAEVAAVQIALEPGDEVPACTGVPPAEWLEISLATAHGGPIVGVYEAYDGDGLLTDQRAFRATHRVGGTGTGLSAIGDVLEITVFDPATGRAEGLVELADYGEWSFAVDVCP